MRFRTLLLVAVVWQCLAAAALAQFKEGGETNGVRLGDSKVTRWKAGMIVTASNGACRGLNGYVPVPMEWPEQTVHTVKEEHSPEIRIGYETIGGGARIMTIKISQLSSGHEATVSVIVEVRRSTLLPPKKTDGYVLPDPEKLPREIRPYLSPSPKIESRDSKIRDLAKEIGVDKEKAWDHVEAIYDWVREKVKYQPGPLKGALAALHDGTGDCEEITSLFIAICRAANIPARSVWVPGHCYPEFYLEDENGDGHWFPCQSAGARQFGGIDETRPILQKGDNFRPPRNGSKEHQRYLAESLTGGQQKGGGKPQCQFIGETAPEE
jgi:hypothetical protein